MKIKLFIPEGDIPKSYYPSETVFLDDYHPSRQLEVLLYSLNREVLFLETTNDMTLQHINNLISLGEYSNETVSEEHGYQGYLILKEDIYAVEVTESLAERELVWQNTSDSLGYCAEWMVDNIIKLNEKTIVSFQEREKAEE